LKPKQVLSNPVWDFGEYGISDLVLATPTGASPIDVAPELGPFDYAMWVLVKVAQAAKAPDSASFG